MGDVVKLDPAPKMETPRRRSPSSDRVALVLGGGGLTGGVYEIGALRALDLLAVNRSVNDLDIYVGTSAGSFVAALTANGVTPAEMMQVVNGRGDTPFRDVGVGTAMRPNVKEFVRTGALFPLRLARLAAELIPRIGEVSAMDVVLGLGEDLPSGLYSGRGLEKYLEEILSDPERTNDFRALGRELYVTATDLDVCERIVFGAEGWDDTPISRAVRASTALPMLYKPVRVGDRELVDGGIISTTNVDVAVAAGATLIIVVNPLVPYVGDHDRSHHDIPGARPSHISDMGMAQIGYQSFRLIAWQRLHEVAAKWEKRYPDVDIVLIEPDPDDLLMSETAIMDFTKRVEIARHGFQSVTVKLADNYDYYKEILARHGITISATRVRKVVRHVTREQEKTRAWKRILEQTTGSLLRQSEHEPDPVDVAAGRSA